MISRAWLVPVWVCATSLLQGAKSQGVDQTPSHSPKYDGDEKSGRRSAVCRGVWSGETVALFNTWMSSDTNPERRLDFPSPDGKKIIRVRGFQVRLSMNGKQYWTPFGMMHDAEVGWAPDSTRLFVTWTETGQLGPWHTRVFDITDSGLIEIPGVTRHVRGDWIARMKKALVPERAASGVYRRMRDTLDYCAYEAVGSQWLNGSKEILVAALAGPDSGCKYMGDFVAYRIEVSTGNFLQAYTEREAAKILGNESLPVIDEDEDEI